MLTLQNPTWTSVALAAVGEEHNVDLAGKCILFDQLYKLGKQFPSVFSISHLYKTTKPLAEWIKWCDSFRNLIRKHLGFGRNILPDLGLESWSKHSQRNIQSIDVYTHHLSQSSVNDTVFHSVVSDTSCHQIMWTTYVVQCGLCQHFSQSLSLLHLFNNIKYTYQGHHLFNRFIGRHLMCGYLHAASEN